MRKQTAALAESLCQELVQTLQGLCCELANDTPTAALARGKVFQLSGYYEDAVDSYESALGCDPDLDEAAARLVIAQLQARQPENALASATKLAQRNPGYELKEMTSTQAINSMTLLGDALASNGRLDDSIEAYKLALGASKNDVFAAGRVAQAYLAAGNPQSALEQAPNIGTNQRFRSLTALLELGRQNVALLPKFANGGGASLLSISAPGRPLFVEGAARVAPIVWGDDGWCAERPDQA
jgi:tetratricopeptide (TPR) repeat protein